MYANTCYIDMKGVDYKVFTEIIALIIMCAGYNALAKKGNKNYEKRKRSKKKTTSIWTYKPPAKKKPRRLPGVHADYNELLKQKLIKEGKYD